MENIQSKLTIPNILTVSGWMRIFETFLIREFSSEKNGLVFIDLNLMRKKLKPSNVLVVLRYIFQFVLFCQLVRKRRLKDWE